MINILVLGSNGMLGSHFCQTVKSSKKLKLTKFSRKNFSLDLTKKLDVRKLLKIASPEIIINFCGLTDVDYCENFPKEADLVNAKIPKNLSEFSGYLIHISTDQVYPGIRGNYEENDSFPINEYGKSKLKGEKSLNNKKALIIRTNFFGPSLTKRKSLSDFFIESFKKKKKTFLFEDLFFSPLHMTTLTKVIENIILKNRIKGVYNLGSLNGISKSSFALKIAKHLNLSNPHNQKINSESLSYRAKRPKNTTLNSQKISDILNLKIPTIEKEIKKL